MKKILKLENKSYNKCFACEHLNSPRCNGPRTSCMDLHRWCEYMRDLAAFFNLTNEYIAEKADVSLKTITKIMSCKCDQDIMRDTARRIEDVIFNAEAQSPCFLAFEQSVQPDAKKLREAELQLINLQANLKMLNETFKQEIEAVRSEAQTKIDYLRKESEKKDAIISKLLER